MPMQILYLGIRCVSCSEASVGAVSATEECNDQEDMIQCQEQDEDLKRMFAYIREGILPEEENIAKKIILESSLYDLLNGVLCHEDLNYPESWRIVIPSVMRSTPLEKLHVGKFSGHFAWKKLYNSIKKKFLWKGMCGDVEKYCRSCLECVTRSGSRRTVNPPLSPIPVGGPFHRMGVDILQLPLTQDGNISSGLCGLPHLVGGGVPYSGPEC